MPSTATTAGNRDAGDVTGGTVVSGRERATGCGSYMPRDVRRGSGGSVAAAVWAGAGPKMTVHCFVARGPESSCEFFSPSISLALAQSVSWRVWPERLSPRLNGPVPAGFGCSVVLTAAAASKEGGHQLSGTRTSLPVLNWSTGFWRNIQLHAIVVAGLHVRRAKQSASSRGLRSEPGCFSCAQVTVTRPGSC